MQQALLALALPSKFKLMITQARTVEVDRCQRPALRAVIFKATVVRQAQVLELAAGVVAVPQRAPALMLGDQPVVVVVLELQRVVLPVVDADQPPQPVVAILDLAAVRQGFDQ
ncbi:hypothetical protein D3C78_1652850 [compost metagenome]